MGQFALFVGPALSTRGCFTMDTNVSMESSFSLLLPQMEWLQICMALSVSCLFFRKLNLGFIGWGGNCLSVFFFLFILRNRLKWNFLETYNCFFMRNLLHSHYLIAKLTMSKEKNFFIYKIFSVRNKYINEQINTFIFSWIVIVTRKMNEIFLWDPWCFNVLLTKCYRTFSLIWLNFNTPPVHEVCCRGTKAWCRYACWVSPFGWSPSVCLQPG